MIYVIRSGDAIKVGYSVDVNKRMAAYRTHNPNTELLRVSPKGGKRLEKSLHKRLSKYHISGEWFDYSIEVLKLINDQLDNFESGVRTVIQKTILVTDPDQSDKVLEEITITHRVYHIDEPIWQLID